MLRLVCWKIRNTVRLKHDDDGDFVSLKSSDAMLPRKASRVNYIGACTENRHRWARRVS